MKNNKVLPVLLSVGLGVAVEVEEEEPVKD